MAEPRWFYRDDNDWNAIVERLKLTACPHCRTIGTLVRHGYLSGYDGGRLLVREHGIKSLLHLILDLRWHLLKCKEEC